MIIPKKTVVIKLFEAPADMNKTAEKPFAILEDSIRRIMNSQILETSLQELYLINENFHVTHKEILYDKLHVVVEEALFEKLDKLTNNIEELLVSLNHIWSEFCDQVCILRNIYLPCDRSTKTNKANTVQHLSKSLFKSTIVSNPFIKGCLTFEILYLVQIKRKGEKIDTILLHSLLSMLNDLQVYHEIFHVEFLKLSHLFYLDEAKILIDSVDIRVYLKHVQARINQEQEMAKNFPEEATANCIVEIVCKNLIKDKITFILDKVFGLLFKNQIKEELGILYALLKEVPLCLKNLSRYFSDHTINKGKQIMNKPNNEKTMIQELLDFRDELDWIVIHYFDRNESYNDIIRNAFSKFINTNQNKPAQFLAKFVDSKLRAKDISEHQLEVYMNKAMVLFRYIQGKDIFEAFYKKDLAKRLLLGKSTSQDAEDSMIGKLKSECGSGFTSKIEGMFKDINISHGMNNAFKHHLHNIAISTSSDLFINVLTSSFWPSYPTYEVNLPLELANYQTTFQSFYANNHSGRKLVWQPNLGFCLVKAAFDSGNKELQVSLFQTIVLLLFNESRRLTFSEIQELTNIEEDELKRTLLSLACNRSRVLLKESRNKDIQADDIFYYNCKFHDKLFRVKINQIQLKESVEERQATEKSVLADRQFQIDAAVVRILKNKKKINHNELISELFNALEIPVKPYDLKKRIELLIEREYLERDKDNPAYYTYIA